MLSLLGPLDTTKLKSFAGCSRQSASPVNSPTSWPTNGKVSKFLHQSSPTSGKSSDRNWLPPRRLLSISKPNFRKGCRGWKSSKQIGPCGSTHQICPNPTFGKSWPLSSRKPAQISVVKAVSHRIDRHCENVQRSNGSRKIRRE